MGQRTKKMTDLAKQSYFNSGRQKSWLAISVTQSSEVSFAPSVEGAVVGDCRRMSISGGNEDHHFAGERTKNLFGNFLSHRVPVAEFAVVPWNKEFGYYVNLMIWKTGSSQYQLWSNAMILKFHLTIKTQKFDQIWMMSHRQSLL